MYEGQEQESKWARSVKSSQGSQVKWFNVRQRQQTKMVGWMSEHMYTALHLTEEGGEILSLRRALPFAWQRSNLLYNSFDVLGTRSRLVCGVVRLCYGSVSPFWRGGQQYRFWLKSVSRLAAIQLEYAGWLL
jgi:hypothetical protein